jgi:hypothetical protein
MKTSNFALRLQPTLMEEAKALAKAEGVALNQIINVALAEKLAAARTIAFFEHYTRDADVAKALALLRRPRVGEPPREGDELPESWLAGSGGQLRIRGPKQYKVVKEFKAFRDGEEGCALDEVQMRRGYFLQTFPEEEWRGRIWNGFEAVKFRLSSSSLRARLEDFENCTEPASPAQG